MEHDFMTEQPVKGADVYLIRWVLHNWSDKYCLRILRNLIPALKNGARIVIQDNCLPEPNTLSYTEEAKLRYVVLIHSQSHICSRSFTKNSLYS